MSRLILFVITVALLGCSSPEPAPVPEEPEGAVEITEWPVPWENTRPRDPYVGAQGRVWFVGQRGDYLAYLDPASGEFTRFELDPGTGPHNLIVDGGGTVWYAGNTAAHIGKLDPQSGDVVKFLMPDPAATDPHTLVFDGNGDVWFTVQAGGFVGRLAAVSGETTLVPMPAQGSRPYGIVVDSGGRPWVCEFGTNKIATIDPETMQLEEIELPRADARPRRMALTSDGAVWYVDYGQGYLGRLDPATRQIEEWPAPGGSNALPYGMAADDRDRIWFVQTGPQPNELVGFDTGQRSFIGATEIPSGGGVVRNMVFDARTGALWFGTDKNTIGRAALP